MKKFLVYFTSAFGLFSVFYALAGQYKDVPHSLTASENLQRAYNFLDANDIDSSLMHLEKILKMQNLNPNILSEAYAGASLCLYFMDEAERASISKKNAIRLNPEGMSEAVLKKHPRWTKEMILVFFHVIP